MALGISVDENPTFRFSVEKPHTTMVDGKLQTTIEKTKLVLTKNQIVDWIERFQKSKQNEELEKKAERHFKISITISCIILALLITTVFLNYYFPNIF
jgi:Tfp pilus assembly ATPase PilU